LHNAPPPMSAGLVHHCMTVSCLLFLEGAQCTPLHMEGEVQCPLEGNSVKYFAYSLAHSYIN